MRFLVYIKKLENAPAHLEDEAARRGHALTLIRPPSLIAEDAYVEKLVTQIRTYDVFHFFGGLPPKTSLAIDQALATVGVPSVNSKVRVPAGYSDKWCQFSQLSSHGIPTPKSVRVAQVDFDNVVRLVGLPFIAKTRTGSQGAGVFLIRTREDMASVAHHTNWLFQEYIPNDGDFRVHVAGMKRAFAPYRRTPASGDFRANVSRGGTMSAVDDEVEYRTISTLAVRSAQAMQLDLCGIDIIKHAQTGEYFVIESNSSPGWKNVSAVSGDSSAAAIIDLYETMARGG